MPDFIVYLLKANLSLALFYVAYHFYLKRLTFYTLNRCFLIFGIFFSFAYPLVNNLKHWLAPVQGNAVAWERLIPDWQHINEQTRQLFDAWDAVVLFFWCMVLFFALRFMIRLYGLWQIHRQSNPSTFHFYSYRQVLLNINPFSFWKNIYLNPSKHQPYELTNILMHEQVHVNGLHTFDVILAEVVSILFWFNPSSWLLRKAIKENLEFITDREVLRSGADKKAYQYSLLKVLTNADQPALANNFNLKNLKKRIMMMNSKKSSHANLSKYILITPIITLFVLLFTISKAYEKGLEKELRNLDISILTGQEVKTVPKQDTLKSEKAYYSPEARVDTLPKEKKDTTLNKIVIRGYAGKQPYYIIDGKPVEDEGNLLGKIAAQDIESITVLKDSSATALYGKKGKNGVILVVTKKGTGLESLLEMDETDGKVRVDSVVVYSKDISNGKTTLKGKGKLSEVRITKVDTAKSAVGKIAIISGENKPFDGLYILDGKQVEQDAISHIDLNTIKNVTVLKGSEAVKAHGAEGVNGVIIINTKKADESQNKQNDSSSLTPDPAAVRITGHDYGPVEPRIGYQPKVIYIRDTMATRKNIGGMTTKITATARYTPNTSLLEEVTLLNETQRLLESGGPRKPIKIVKGSLIKSDGEKQQYKAEPAAVITIKGYPTQRPDIGHQK